MVVNPITIAPDATLADVMELKRRFRISGIPVVDGRGVLVGIITNRDVRFATDLGQKVSELMTRENLITVRENVDRDEARRLLHRHRIEKLIVVDDEYRCVGLITVTDMEKAALHPNAAKDEQGRLRVAAATGTGDGGFRRAELLIDAGVDAVVVDTAHGHSIHVIEQVRRIKRLSNKVEVIAGNVATAEAVAALADAGADAVKVGIGPGSICTTRVVAGVGVPQLSAVMECAAEGERRGIPVIADGGIKFSGDLAKALAAGAVLRDDRLAARRHRREPGRGLSLSGPQLQILSRHGVGRRHGARLGRPLFPAGGQGRAQARARGRGRAGALQGAGDHGGASAGRRPAGRPWAIPALPAWPSSAAKAQFIRVSGAGLRESHVHDVEITREAPNYLRRD